MRDLRRQVTSPLLGGIVAAAATMAVAALVPWWIGDSIDYVADGHADAEGIAWRSAALAALTVAGAVFSVIQERLDTRVRVVSSLSALTQVHNQAVKLSGGRRGASIGNVINLGLGDIRPIGSGIASLSRGVGGFVAVIIVSFILLSTSWLLCALVQLGVIVLLWSNDRFMIGYRASAKAVREAMGNLTGIALDATSGLRVIKGLGATAQFSDRYHAGSRAVLDAANTMARAEGLVVGGRALTSGVLGLATVWLGAHLVRSGSLTVGDLVAAYGYAIFLATPIRWLLTTHQQWASAKVSAARLADYLTIPAAQNSTMDEAEGCMPGIKDAKVGWEAKPGLYTVVTSAQEIDWAQVADSLDQVPREPSELRVIRSDDYLFSGTLGEVLAPEGASNEMLHDAIDAVALTDYVHGLREGMEYSIASGGTGLSGGEQQRVRLARALLAAPRRLVLVEPTTALDSTTEVQVVKLLRSYRAGSTTVVLTNSVPHMIEADQVIFHDENQEPIAGTHTQLMAHSAYRAMIQRQQDEL